jgi:flagellar basal-body rod protein FlgG
MDKGIYTALSGGLAKSHDLELIANNLANVNTPGFKRDSATFNEYLPELRRQDSASALKREILAATIEDGRPPGDKSFVEIDGTYTDFAQGALQRTHRPLDVAIEGEAFFEMWTPSGVRYSRQGIFNLSPEGVLVNQQGFPVLGTSGGEGMARAIRLDNVPVQIGEDGAIYQRGNRVAQISTVGFHQRQYLEKVGAGLYLNTASENLSTAPANSKIHQGFIEGSNVNPVKEMTRLIEATRGYESSLQAIRTYQEIDRASATGIVKGGF